MKHRLPETSVEKMRLNNGWGARLMCTVIWALLIKWASAVAVAGAFLVEGFITLTDAQNHSQRFCDFSARVSGDKYNIRGVYFNGEAFACGSDGADAFLLNEMVPTRGKNPTAPQFGYISASPFPDQALTPIQLVWLAFVSNAYLKQTGSNVALEVFHDFRHQTTYQVDKMEPRGTSPVSMKFFGPNFLLSGTNQAPNPDYPNGFLLGDFAASDYEELAGFRVPTMWQLNTFRQNSSPGRHDLARDDVMFVQSLRGSVTNREEIAVPDEFIPKISAPASITDFRFVDSVGYGFPVPIVDGSWPQRGSPVLVNLVNAHLASHPLNTGNASRVWIWLAIVSVTAMAGIAAIKKSRNKKKPHYSGKTI